MARSGAARATRAGAALAGAGAAVLGAGAGELVGAFVGTSPFAAIGAAAIDLAPPWAKDTAIALFGTADKAALLIAIATVLLATAAGAGLLERRLPPWGRALLAALGGLGVAAAVTRANAGALSWLPAVLAAAVAIATLGLLIRRAPADVPAPGGAATRRAFLVWTGTATALGALAALGGIALRAGARAVTAARDALVLPRAGVAATVPATADLSIPGLTPIITPNADFYRIDTALVVPEVDPAGWSLRLHGLVENEVTVTWDELLALPLEESVTTLACVSNTVGGDLIGTAVWLGYPIRALLARARPRPGADMVLSTSADGFTAGTPLETLTDGRDAILAVGMNGEPLPLAHGFPVRMVVPGLYGYVSATKWVVDLEVTRFADATAYWSTRGWSERGPVKLESRIDVPRVGASVPAGDAVIAGIAWQQHVGVSAVEVQVDDDAWRRAALAPAISDDTWVQWMLPWVAASGPHTIRCRAISADGETQTPDEAPPAPDGATGWHEIEVTVA